MSSGIEASCSVIQKPLAILFYQAQEDAAFNLSDAHAQRRVRELCEFYDLSCVKVDTIFEAKLFAQKSLGDSNRKISHLEFAGHGSQTELIFNKNASGGVISPSLVSGREELKELVNMVDPYGIIVSQSCSNGSTKLKGMNVLEYITSFTTPGQRVVGANDQMNMFHMISIRHFHLIKSMTSRGDENVTAVYLKTINGIVQHINIHCIDFLYEHIFDRNPDKSDLCYELMAYSSDPVKSQELIALHCPELPKKLSEYFHSLQIKKREGTDWTPIFDDLERVAQRLGWQEDPRVELSKERRSLTPVEKLDGIHFGENRPVEPYRDTYEFLLALSELEYYYDLLRLLDNGKCYDQNPACLPLYRLTQHVWHPDLQPLGYVRHNLEIIKRSYQLFKTQGDSKLIDWFRSAFKRGCFEDKLNSAYSYYADSGILALDPMYDMHAIFIDDTLRQVVQKSYSALLVIIYRRLRIDKDPHAGLWSYPFFEIMKRASNVLRFTRSQLEKYQIPATKFSDEEILREIGLGNTCLPDEKLPVLINRAATFNFKDLIFNEDLTHISAKSLALEYPNNAANCLFDLSFSIEDAIIFCITHQIRRVDLNFYRRSITKDLLRKLLKENKKMKEFFLYKPDQMIDDEVRMVAEEYDYYLIDECKSPKYHNYGILPEDSLFTIVINTYQVILAKNRLLLEIKNEILPDHPLYQIFRIMNWQSDLLLTIRSQLAKYQVPDTFSDEELQREIGLYLVPSPSSSQIEEMIEEIAKTNFEILMKFGNLIHISRDDLLSRYPTASAHHFKSLGFSVQDLIDYCIVHQFERVDLNPFSDKVTDAMVLELVRSNDKMRYLNMSKCLNISDEEVAKLAVQYPHLTIHKPPKIEIELQNIREAFPNITVIDASVWKSLGILAENVPLGSDREILEKISIRATLMLMPKDLSALNLNDSVNIIGDRALIEGFLETPNEKAYWVLLSNDILYGTRSKSLGTQMHMIHTVKGKLPSFLEVAALACVTFRIHGIRLFSSKKPITYTRVSNLFRGKCQVVIGCFSEKGIYVYYRDYDTVYHGAAIAYQMS